MDMGFGGETWGTETEKTKWIRKGKEGPRESYAGNERGRVRKIEREGRR